MDFRFAVLVIALTCIASIDSWSSYPQRRRGTRNRQTNRRLPYNCRHAAGVDGASGLCVQLERCPPLERLLRNQHLLDGDVLYRLQRAICAFDNMDPLVCCNEGDVIPVLEPEPFPEPGPGPFRPTTATSRPTHRPPPPVTRPPPPVTRPPPPVTRPPPPVTRPPVTSPPVVVPPVVTEPPPPPPPATRRPPAPPTGGLRSHQNAALLPADGQCGQQLVPGTGSSGGNSSAGQFRWVARLRYTVGPRTQFLCSGALINERYVLTSGRCVNKLPSSLRLDGVRVGDYRGSTNNDCDDVICIAPLQDHNLESIVVHPDMDNPRRHHDIALIRLATPVRFDNATQPICLPWDESEDFPTVDTSLHLAGWNRTEFDSFQGSDVMQVATVRVTDAESCFNAHSRNVDNLGNGHVCAMGRPGLDNTCSGDSGGPLVTPGDGSASQPHRLAGILSFGQQEGCSRSELPTVYSRTVSYMPWILDSIRP